MRNETTLLKTQLLVISLTYIISAACMHLRSQSNKQNDEKH